jgi:List-Bact-rpt repeat protein
MNFFCKLFPRSFLILLPLLTATTWPDQATAAPQITISWAYTSTLEDGFKIERETETNGTFAQIATVAASATSYTDTQVTSGTSYCYRVRAYNATSNSPYSGVVCDTVSNQTFTLTVSKTGSGTVSSAPVGISCGATCAAYYASGTVVALTATPASGSTFGGWGGDSDCTDGSVSMTVAKTCTATFTLIPQSFPLTVTKAGTGSGAVTATGINCGTDCSEAYPSGTTVALTASPAPGSTFTAWSGDADCIDGSVSMTAAKTCTATFTGSLKVQIGVFRRSTATWLLDLNGNGIFDNCTTDSCPTSLGISSDIPVVGDWTGTGAIQLGTFDPSTRVWELDRNGNDKWEDCTVDICKGPFGRTGDLPISGYWKTGTASTQLGTFRPSNATWYLDLNGNGRLDKGNTDAKLGPFGASTDLPVVGDWTGSGTTKIGTFNSATGMWQLDRNGNGSFDGCAVDGCAGPFGKAGNLPVAADWNGTGTAKIGTFDPVTGMWQLDMNGNGTFDGCTSDACVGPFGQQGDRPVVGKW